MIDLVSDRLALYGSKWLPLEGRSNCLVVIAFSPHVGSFLPPINGKMRVSSSKHGVSTWFES